jgi:hypothetical protein
MTIWNRIKERLNESLRNKYQGTADKEARIGKSIEKGKSVTIAAPSSMRTMTTTISSPVARSVPTESSTMDIQVPSSAVQDIKYNPKTERADVTFTNGKHSYEYVVDNEDMKAFLNAPSKGKFIAEEWNHNPEHRAPGY